MTLLPLLPPTGGRFGLFFPIGMQAGPGQSQAWKLPSSPMAHIYAMLARVGVQTGWDHFVSFPAKLSGCKGIWPLAFGLGPLGLMLHHCCFLACQKGAKRNECHMQLESTWLIILGSQLFTGVYICEEISKIEKSYFIRVHELSQGIINHAMLGKTMNGEIKFSTIWLHCYSLIHSFIQQLPTVRQILC